MRKIILTIFICVSCFLSALAQTKEKNYISLKVGPAIAIDRFASKNLYSELAGFAKTGMGFSVSYDRLLSKYLGIAIDVRGQRNPVNTSAFESNFGKLYSNYPRWKFEKKNWLLGSALLGVVGHFKIDQANKWMLTTKIMAGASFAKSPGLTGTSFTDTSTANVEQNKRSATGFIYSVQAELNYSISKSVFLSAAVAYAETNSMNFKGVSTTTITTNGIPGSPGYSVTRYMTTSNGKQKISLANILVGIGFKF